MRRISAARIFMPRAKAVPGMGSGKLEGAGRGAMGHIAVRHCLLFDEIRYLSYKRVRSKCCCLTRLNRPSSHVLNSALMVGNCRGLVQPSSNPTMISTAMRKVNHLHNAVIVHT